MTVPPRLRQQALVDGVWIDATDSAQIDVSNPATGDVIGTVPALSAAEVVHAIDRAEVAMQEWRKTMAAERAEKLMAWHHAIVEDAERLASILTFEQGKPLAEARGEIAYAVSYIQWFAEEARRIEGRVIPANRPDRQLLTIQEPVGVCAAITPWNFPAAMVTRKIAPALAAGCAVILKPDQRTPFTALALAEYAIEAGIPPGLFSVVTGEAETVGGVLSQHPTIRKLSFTGSTAVGRLLMRQAAPTLKRLSLELGGNAPFIVFEDADIAAAVEGGIAAKFRNNGQTCVCVNRFYVHSSVHDDFVVRFVAAARDLHASPGGQGSTPLIDDAAIRKVADHIADAVEKGGSVRLGEAAPVRDSRFMMPTVITGGRADMRVAQEETFGPLAVIFRFEDERDVLKLANETEFGLAAYFYSRDLARVWRVARALDYGMVAINTGLMSTEVAPFGGVKQSGFGREGGREGIRDYLSSKFLCMAGL